MTVAVVRRRSAIRAPLALPADALERFVILQSRVGQYVRIMSGDFLIEGTLVLVLRAAEGKHPVVALEVEGERVVGPILAGDVLC